MAKSTGLGLVELPSVFEQLEPDVVLTVGDRFETMSTTLAAVAYMNIPLAHTMGGEVSGTIDESIRHAVTKFAHIHFPACNDARDRIIRLGERPEDVHMVGCPRIDLVKEILERDNNGLSQDLFGEGVGDEIDLTKPFVVLSQHPVTIEYGEGQRQIRASLKAIQRVGIPAIVLWPNADAGSEDIARGMRKFRELDDSSNFHFFKNLPIETYVQLLNRTSCLIGNSSSAIREGPYIGVPSINVGSRQDMRQRGSNVIDVDYDEAQIVTALKRQLDHGKYESEPIYGDGTAGRQVADVLATVSWELQKRITY